MSAGKQIIFIYVNTIEYQYLGDTKAPLIQVIDSKQRLKNGSPCEIEPKPRIIFSNLEYKKLLSKNFQSIEIQLWTETGELVPFAGTGKVILTLNFKKLTKLKLLSTAIGVTIFRETIVNDEVVLGLWHQVLADPHYRMQENFFGLWPKKLDVNLLFK